MAWHTWVAAQVVTVTARTQDEVTTGPGCSNDVWKASGLWEGAAVYLYQRRKRRVFSSMRQVERLLL